MRNLIPGLWLMLAICLTGKASAQCIATLTATDTAVCVGENVTLYATPTGLYDYQWFIDGSLGQLGPDSLVFGGWSSGLHTFAVQITDNNNCTVISNIVTVNVYPTPSGYIISNSPLCAGSTLLMNASVGTGTTVTWFGPNNFSASGLNASLPNFQGTDVGSYYLLVTNGGCAAYAGNTPIDTISNIVSIDPHLTNNAPHACEGDPCSLDGFINGFISPSFSWTGPNSFSSNQSSLPFATNLSDSGMYIIAVSGATCNGPQTLIDSFLLNVYPMPGVTVISNGPVCEGTTVQLNASISNVTSYSWSGPNNFSSTQLTDSIPNAQLINSGQYTFMATNGYCWSWTNANGTVNSNTPTFSWGGYWQGGYDPCAGAYVQLYLSYTDIFNPSFLWAGPVVSDTQQNFTFTIMNSLDSGMYYVSTSGANCAGTPVIFTDSFLLDVKPCVWPGDVNNDLLTNNFDVLDLGLAYGTQGPVRPNSSYQWFGQYLADWGVMQYCGYDMKYADCNGNGIITASDTFGIALNYNQTHQKGVHLPQGKSASNPDLYFDMTGIVLTPGAIVSIPIKLGTTSIPMANVYGIAAQVKISGTTPVNGMTVDAPAGWMGSLADALNFTHLVNYDQTDWAYVRTDQNNASGQGTVAILEFEVPAGSEYQQVQFYFDNVKIIGNTGTVITNVNIVDDTATVYPVGIVNNVSFISDAVVLPNPSEGQANLQLSVVKDSRISVSVYDITGRNTWSGEISVSKGIHQMQLPSELAAGIYNIQVKDEKGATGKTMKWVKGK